ncbi:hypothetical protein Ocin01_11719 [Orchesella cincta]|uniref:Uncharacterized protein n=1 Tax=Orchesella cincta TaxID=48709 RepID=A0A1D2MQ08_ORCCI|nr:hypothetical protein Ocin01_11719 [Orchesella cincta]
MTSLCSPLRVVQHQQEAAGSSRDVFRCERFLHRIRRILALQDLYPAGDITDKDPANWDSEPTLIP